MSWLIGSWSYSVALDSFMILKKEYHHSSLDLVVALQTSEALIAQAASTDGVGRTAPKNYP